MAVSFDLSRFVLVGLIPTAIVYRKIMLYYLATSRELKRLDSTSRAPIFSWFGESLTGLSTIRAFGQTERFSANSEGAPRSRLGSSF